MTIRYIRSKIQTMPNKQDHIQLFLKFLWINTYCIAFILPFHCFSQSNNIGSPPLKNYTKKDYRAGTQNWQIAQDQRGIVYAANNHGLLEFNGNHWRLYPLKNGTNLRSFKVAEDGKIYVGGQGEIGYFEGNEMGVLTFYSLNGQIPKEFQKFEDVWEILIDNGAVYFMAWRMIMKWADGKMTIPIADEGYLFFDKIGDRYFLQKANGAFGFFEGQLNAPFQKITDFSGEITSMVAYHPDTLLITSDAEGILQLVNSVISAWPASDDPFLKKNSIFCSELLPNGNLAFGSTSAGLVIMDRNKRILQQISKGNGLQNNTVLSVFTNDKGNMWLGLDNGITYVHANSAFTEFFPDGDLEGTCYSVTIFEKHLYAATNTGIYQIPWKPYYLPEEKKDFQLVANSEGQVWSVGQYGGQLLAGLAKGPFIVENGVAKKLADLIGVWRFQAIQQNFLVAGHYGGLALFEHTANGLTYHGHLDGSSESSRLLAYDQGHIWMAHPYRGIFKNDLSVDKKKVTSVFYNSQNGLPSDFNNHLFQLNNKVVFSSEKGVYKYDQSKDGFLPDEDFNEIFGEDSRVKYLKQDANGNIWYSSNDEVGVLWIKDNAIDKKVEKMILPELSDKLVGSFECILPIDEYNVLFATEKGVIHFDPSKYKPATTPPNIVLSEVWLKGIHDSLLFGGYFTKGLQSVVPELTYRQHAFEFVFSSTDHEGQEFVKYAYQLEGTEDSWSPWTDNTSLSINNLRPGNYSLLLKAKNKSDVECEPIAYRFIIRPPWYASTVAYSFYGLMLVGAFIGLAFFQNKKHEKEKAFMATTHLREQEFKEAQVQESREKINQLERQKLEAEVQFKNQELAAATMNLLQKSEMLTSIQASLEKLKKQDGKRMDAYGEINRLLRMVKKENDLSDDWERFSIHFDEVHSDFLKHLGEKFPNLSPNDYKLSAYLRMNLSTKEIASLMNISIRGVEASRYRLRKRLELDKSVNLTEYLMKL